MHIPYTNEKAWNININQFLSTLAAQRHHTKIVSHTHLAFDRVQDTFDK